MKLHEIKPLYESSTPIHLTMILDEIIRDKRVSNTAQWMVLSQLTELFKFGLVNSASTHALDLPLIKPREIYAQPTPKALLDELKRLEPEDQLQLAMWFKDQLTVIKTEADVTDCCHPEMEMTKWINLVTKKQV